MKRWIVGPLLAIAVMLSACAPDQLGDDASSEPTDAAESSAPATTAEPTDSAETMETEEPSETEDSAPAPGDYDY